MTFDGPQPLVEPTYAPHWPVSMLPAWVGDHVTDTAARLQVPEDLCAQLAVGALSAACAGHATVQVDDWQEPLNLYLWCSMHSGAGKSPAEKAMIGPLREWERERRARKADGHAEDMAEWRVAQKKLRKAEDSYSIGSIDQQAFTAAVLEASKPMPAEFRLLVDDATPERLVQLLGAHERLALISTEAGLLDQVAAQFQKGQKPNIDVFLKAWSGDPIIRDRKGGDNGPESTVIDDALLTVVLTIQPGVIERYRETAPELRGRGFFARFMPSIPQSLVGARRFGGRAQVAPSAGVYAERLTALATTMTNLEPAGRPMRLQLDDAAAEMHYRWCDRIETDLAPGRRLAALHDVASKIRSSALRTAGLLMLAHGDGGNTVTADLMSDAIVIAEYWVDHAMLMEAADTCDPVERYALDCALDILDWCRRRQMRRVTPRDVYLAYRSTYRQVDALAPGFELLWEKGWLTFTEGHVSDIGVQRTPVAAEVSMVALTDDPRAWRGSSLAPDSAETPSRVCAQYAAESDGVTTEGDLTRTDNARSPKSGFQSSSSPFSPSTPTGPQTTRDTRVNADNPEPDNPPDQTINDQPGWLF